MCMGGPDTHTQVPVAAIAYLEDLYVDHNLSKARKAEPLLRRLTTLQCLALRVLAV